MSDTTEASALKHSMAMALIAARGLPPGRQVPVVLEALERDGWGFYRGQAAAEERPDPESWTRFVSRTEQLLATGVATSRERTTAAIAELGLNPAEIRAVVIEQQQVRVYRYSDKHLAQTMPIIEETT